MKLKYRFLLIFLSVSLIPTLILSLIVYLRYTTLTAEQINNVSDQIYENALEVSNNRLKDIQNISSSFDLYSPLSDSFLSELKKFKSPDSEYSSYDILEVTQKMAIPCQNIFVTKEFVNGVFFFTPAGPVLGYGLGAGIDIKANYTPFQDEWYKKTLERNGEFYVSSLSEKDFIINASPSISFSKALYDFPSKEFLGILYIDCSPEVFDFSTINTLPNVVLLSIENQYQDILYTNIDTLSIHPSYDKKLIRKSSELEIPGLTLYFSADYEYLYKEFSSTRNLMISIIAICIFFIIPISIFTSRYVSQPITHLSQKMISSGANKKLETSLKYLNRTDEIGVLYNEYNGMVRSIEKYVENEFKNKLITLDSQMKSLEAQINSHFLYNTLESINSIAEIEEVESISTMSMALGKMFRYSIKTQSELVTINDELQHVQNYVAIQQIRFDNRFKIIYDIPPQMKNLKVLKLILQPLVENAFYHGLVYCNYGSYIKIHGYTTDTLIYLIVSDDGIGMKEEQLSEIRAKLSEIPEFTELGHRNNQSIGIKNIHSRISLYYGEKYGLSINSVYKKGASITITLPVVSN